MLPVSFQGLGDQPVGGVDGLFSAFHVGDTQPVSSGLTVLGRRSSSLEQSTGFAHRTSGTGGR